MNKFNQTTPPVQVTPTYADRQFLHTFLAGALLPLVQATITSVMAGIGTFVLLYNMDAVDYLKPILSVSAITWVFTWLFLQRRWLNLTSLERFLNMDINRDGVIGTKAEKKETVVWINDATDQGHVSSMRVALPIEDDELVYLADGLIHRGRPFSRREWTPKANGFSDDEWRELQSACLKFHIVEPRGAGFDLTKAGRAMMRYWASLSPTPVVGGAER